MTADATPNAVPVDQWAGQFYPGFEPGHASMPWVTDPLGPFQPADNDAFWFRDGLHFGRGIAPASVALLDDAQTLGTQTAAEIVGVPPSKGSVDRFIGTHIYLGVVGVSSPWEIGARAERFGTFVRPRLADFDSYWGTYETELRAGYDHFDNLDLDAMGRDELWQSLQDAYVFHRRGWYIHFEVMYSLVTNYLAFYQLAVDLDLDPRLVSRYLAGKPTFYIETDEQLWKLAGRARELGVADAITDGDTADARSRIEATAQGGTWWAEFEAFLEVYGQRMEETCMMETAPWVEDPAPALHKLDAILRNPDDHDFEVAQREAIETRDAYIEAAREELGGGEELAQFNEMLATNQAANFAWWNDEHNALIDRRIAIPVRRLTLTLAPHLVEEGRISEPTDMFFVFKHELYDAMGGDEAEWERLKALIPERRAYYDQWRERGPELPPVVGTVPPRIEDPIMIEIFGITEHYLRTVTASESQAQLTGFPASRGVAEGTARVIHSVNQLSELEPGEILVCNGTTAEWTAVYGIIKACVCDGGGSLSHAAIVSREYGVPCVVGTARATATISTGDQLRVDGNEGTVEIIG